MEHRALHAPLKAVLRLLYPTQCIGCGQIVVGDDSGDAAHGRAGGLCHECWSDIHFISGCICTSCGVPLPDDGASGDEGLICDECLTMPRPWCHGRAALAYSGTGRDLVLALKHGDRPDLAPALAGWLLSAVTPIIRPDMIVAPVPLHFRRLLKRRYNQAALLARYLSKAAGLRHQPDLLLRHHHRPAQGHGSVSDRFANVAGTMKVNPRLVAQVAGRHVLLIDDVMASGATLSTAADALLAAGFGSVSVAVLARAVKGA